MLLFFQQTLGKPHFPAIPYICGQLVIEDNYFSGHFHHTYTLIFVLLDGICYCHFFADIVSQYRPGNCNQKANIGDVVAVHYTVCA